MHRRNFLHEILLYDPKNQPPDCTDCPKPSEWQSVPPLKLLSKNTRADLQLVTFKLHFDLISCCSPRLQHQRLHRTYWHTLKEVVYRCLILKSVKNKAVLNSYHTSIKEYFFGMGDRQVCVDEFSGSSFSVFEAKLILRHIETHFHRVDYSVLGKDGQTFVGRWYLEI